MSSSTLPSSTRALVAAVAIVLPGMAPAQTLIAPDGIGNAPLVPAPQGTLAAPPPVIIQPGDQSVLWTPQSTTPIPTINRGPQAYDLHGISPLPATPSIITLPQGAISDEERIRMPVRPKSRQTAELVVPDAIAPELTAPDPFEPQMIEPPQKTHEVIVPHKRPRAFRVPTAARAWPAMRTLR